VRRSRAGRMPGPVVFKLKNHLAVGEWFLALPRNVSPSTATPPPQARLSGPIRRLRAHPCGLRDKHLLGGQGSWAAEPWSKIVAISRNLSSRIQLIPIQVAPVAQPGCFAPTIDGRPKCAMSATIEYLPRRRAISGRLSRPAYSGTAARVRLNADDNGK
jgi:hypothetical protein